MNGNVLVYPVSENLYNLKPSPGWGFVTVAYSLDWCLIYKCRFRVSFPPAGVTFGLRLSEGDVPSCSDVGPSDLQFSYWTALWTNQMSVRESVQRHPLPPCLLFPLLLWIRYNVSSLPISSWWREVTRSVSVSWVLPPPETPPGWRGALGSGKV